MARIPAELVAFLESGVSVIVGTRDSRLRPEVMRGAGLRVDRERERVTIALPLATGARTLANLKANGLIAVTASDPPTHRTLQLKGKVCSLREGAEQERAVVETYLAGFSDSLAFVGVPKQLTSRLSVWPAYFVTFDVAEVFVQTPGPKAGTRLVEES